jgi:oxazoline/thiazoline synthase
MFTLSPAFQINFLSGHKVVLFSETDNYFIQDRKVTLIIKKIHENMNNRAELSNALDELKRGDDKFDVLLEDLINKGIVLRCNEQDDNKVPHLAFWNSLKISSSHVRKRLEQHVVSIIYYINYKTDEIASVFESLGMKTGENGTFYVVIVNDYLEPRIQELCTELNRKQIPWMLVKPAGKTVWIGPIFNASPEFFYINWDLLSTRIKENSHSKIDIFGYDAAEIPLSVSLELPTNRAVACNIAANEVLKWIISGRSELSNNILTYNVLNLEMKMHHFSEHLQHLARPLLQKGLIEFQKTKKEFSNEFGDRSCSPETTYEKIKPLISPITGFISRFYYRFENNFHIYYGTRSLSFNNKDNRFIPPRPPDVVVGKSKSKKEAEVAFIAEALERYFSKDLNLHSKHLGSYREVAESAIHPYRLMGFSSKQYANRLELNAKSGPYHWIPLPFDESSRISWIKLNSLNSTSSKLFPASHCYMSYLSSQEFLMCPGDSNGCASGNTFEEAILYGLLEVIERDSMAIWWYNRLSRPSIALDTFNSPFIESAQEKLWEHGRTLCVIDISSENNIPAFAALSWREDGSRIVMGSGAHLNPQIGIQRAIAEHNQILTRATVPESIDIASVLPAERDLVRWLIHEKLSSHSFLKGAKKKLKTKGEFKNLTSDSFYTDIQVCLKALANSGLDVFWIPLTPGNFPLKVVKVIVPDMRHFWRRIGEGRLYTIPVLTKDLKIPLTEDQMNPISYFV